MFQKVLTSKKYHQKVIGLNGNHLIIGIVKRGLTDQLEYVTYDTIYVTGFNGMEVPTINPASYSNGDGEFNQMFAPVKSMRGDTVTVTVARQDYFGEWQGVEFYVVLD